MTPRRPCTCDRCLPIEAPGGGDTHCDHCKGSVPPWPGLTDSTPPSPCPPPEPCEPAHDDNPKASTDRHGRACVVCGASLDGRRKDAFCCSGSCRAERSRLTRLRAGLAVDGFASLDAYVSRSRRGRQPVGPKAAVA